MFRDREPVGRQNRGRLRRHSSVIRKQLYPDEGEPRYSGVNMWRGVTRWKPILSGASMLRAGWLATGKLVHYPIRNRIDADGRQLVNWLWEIETPQYKRWDWNRPARVEDFIAGAESWRFDWLDVPAFLRARGAGARIPDGRQGPAARVELRPRHAPRRCRASHGAARLEWRGAGDSGCEGAGGMPRRRTAILEKIRGAAARADIQRGAREPAQSPDAILREVYERTGDQPFERIEAVISAQELAALSDRYKQVAGYDKDKLRVLA